ncbi:hypothetical protein [Meiothermus hypogaeus]|nr:hypothetical protein [Meiothermus hypogaeus]
MPMYLYAFLLFALLTGCGQTAATTPAPDRHTLQTFNDQLLPVTLFDDMVQEPENPPYRFRLEVTDGWFRLERSSQSETAIRYEQAVYFRESVEGNGGRRWRWYDLGTCTPQGSGMRCDSGYAQGYSFELKQQGETLITQQQLFYEPLFKGTYTFSR